MTSNMDDGSEAVEARPKATGAKGKVTAAPEEAAPKAKRRQADAKTAEEMATKQRDISVSEFFAKNRHLLGFDNPRKALLTTVKEAVDNALDACEEAGIRPDLYVEIQPVKDEEDRFRVIVEDNGPGIVKEQIGKIFAKLLYGSKFFTVCGNVAVSKASEFPRPACTGSSRPASRCSSRRGSGRSTRRTGSSCGSTRRRTSPRS